MDVERMKQCPTCGYVNPPNNSFCVGCKGSMTDVAPIPDTKLEDPGYQPPADSAEVLFFCAIASLIAVAHIYLVSRQFKQMLQAERDYIAETFRCNLRAVLRSRFGRTPTHDEVESLVCGFDDSRLGEGYARIARIFESAAEPTCSPEEWTMLTEMMELKERADRSFQLAHKYGAPQ